MGQTQDAGARGEAVAAAFLRKKRYAILAKNVRTPYGEIDMVCRDGKTLVFVEVRFRTNVTFGQPEETVVGRKLERMRQSAEWYVAEHSIRGDYRLDVVGIRGTTGAVTHLQAVGAR